MQGEAIADITAMQCLLGIAANESNFDYDKYFRQYAKVWKQICTRELEYYRLMQDEHPLNYLRSMLRYNSLMSSMILIMYRREIICIWHRKTVLRFGNQPFYKERGQSLLSKGLSFFDR